MAESSKKSDGTETNSLSDVAISVASIPTMLLVCGIVGLAIGAAVNAFTGNGSFPFPS